MAEELNEELRGFDKIGQGFSEVGEDIGAGITGTIDAAGKGITDTINAAGQGLSDFGNNIAEGVSGFANGAMDYAKNVGDAHFNFMNTLTGGLWGKAGDAILNGLGMQKQSTEISVEQINMEQPLTSIHKEVGEKTAEIASEAGKSIKEYQQQEQERIAKEEAEKAAAETEVTQSTSSQETPSSETSTQQWTESTPQTKGPSTDYSAPKASVPSTSNDRGIGTQDCEDKSWMDYAQAQKPASYNFGAPVYAASFGAAAGATSRIFEAMQKQANGIDAPSYEQNASREIQRERINAPETSQGFTPEATLSC